MLYKILEKLRSDLIAGEEEKVLVSLRGFAGVNFRLGMLAGTILTVIAFLIGIHLK